MIVLRMKLGTQPVPLMRVKYARKRPVVGARVYIKPVDSPHSKWLWVRIDKYNEDGFCFASYV